MKKDLRKERKDLYSLKAGISEVDVPRMRFIAVTRKGTVDKRAQEAAEILFEVSYAASMSPAEEIQPEGYYEYEIMPLEALFGSRDVLFDPRSRDTWEWTMMVRQPEFVDEEFFEAIKESVKKKKPGLDLDKAYLLETEEGPSVQMLHMGSYSSVGESVGKMMNYIKEKEYAVNGPYHEIYLSDPNRVEESKLKTIIRFPVVPRSL
jgi:hypothetical protein